MTMPLALLLRRRLRSSASPLALFGFGEQGVWFDPSDVANLNWRRNLLLATDAPGSATGVSVTANAATAPDGTNNAARVSKTDSTTPRYTTQTWTSAAGLPNTVYTVSRYVKYDGFNTTVSLEYNSTTTFDLGWIAPFSVTASGVTADAPQLCTSSVQDVGNGWYRIRATFTSGASTSANTTPMLSRITGASGVSVLMYGAQIELGSVATDYQRITDVNTEVIERFPNATLYQDTAGTTPVTTTGQSVGLMLDKSKGLVLGPELVTNGDFASGTGWITTSWVISGGVATITNASDSIAQNVTFTAGKTYKVTYTLSGFSGTGAFRPRFFGGTTVTGTSVSANGTYSEYMVAVTGNTQFAIATTTATCTGSIDNISVKELPGNHAVQATTANRPIYGIHPVGGRRNLLVRTEEFDNAAWTKFRASITANAAVAPDGTTTADKLIATNILGSHGVNQAVGTLPTTSSVFLKAAEYSHVAIGFNSVTPSVITDSVFDIASGTLVSSGSDVSSHSITSFGNGWYRISVSSSGTATTAQCRVSVMSNSTTIAYTGDNTSGILVWGAQLEAGSTATAYQRVTDQYNVTEAGVSSVSYLFFDGVNDSLATPSINFATATSDGQARRNLLTFPTAFDDAAWTKENATVTANAAVSPDGTTTADKIIATAINSGHGVYQGVATVTSSAYTLSAYFKSSEYAFATLAGYDNATFYATFDLTLGTVVNTTGLSSSSITAVGNGWYRCTISRTATITGTSFWYARPLPTATYTSYTGDGTSGILVWGAQLETGTTASAFQNIGTDKMTVFAGVRKIGTADGMLTELSADAGTNAGAFYVGGPLAAGAWRYAFISRGTAVSAASVTDAAYASPITNVLACLGDISGDRATVRINGTQVVQSTSDQGTGNYGNYPLFIGGRNSASLFFSGHLYSLIVRGAQSNTGQISSTETWVASKTGITI